MGNLPFVLLHSFCICNFVSSYCCCIYIRSWNHDSGATMLSRLAHTISQSILHSFLHRQAYWANIPAPAESIHVIAYLKLQFFCARLWSWQSESTRLSTWLRLNHNAKTQISHSLETSSHSNSKVIVNIFSRPHIETRRVYCWGWRLLLAYGSISIGFLAI